MDPVALTLGVIALVVVVGDLLWTTLWVEGGAGPLTTRLMRGTWAAMRRVGEGHPRFLTLAGPVILSLGLATWIGLLWGGWTLVFAGVEHAIFDTRSDDPVSLVERFYFVGYTLFTMGNGDFTPNEGLWQVLTGLTTSSGMLLITLVVSYVVSVLDAVTQKRAFASNVSGLGYRGEEIVRTAWNGDGEAFRGFDLSLNSYTAEINELTTNHQAYPILHYFYTDRREYATVLGVVALDEALTLLRFGVEEDVRPSDPILANGRSSVGTYLSAVGSVSVRPTDRTPPPPDLDAVREAGIPTVTEERFAESVDDLAERRRMLLGLVETDAREWPGSGRTDASLARPSGRS
ncbi:ion channel [Salinirubellus sp. GCM10025818]|uniref:ion channel n=1 Tax=Salinirubellus TaxID=2162630 RepID=UPI0030CBA42C